MTNSWIICLRTATYGNLEDALTRCRQFLEYGADPNSVMPTGNTGPVRYSSACVELIKSAFRFRCNKAAEQSFLETLELLNEYGAQFPEVPMRDQVYSLFVSELGDRDLDQRGYMVDLTTGGEADDPEREFIAKVMMKVMIKTDWDMSQLWPVIEKFLGT